MVLNGWWGGEMAEAPQEPWSREPNLPDFGPTEKQPDSLLKQLEISDEIEQSTRPENN